MILSTVNKVLAEVCKDVRTGTTSGTCGSGSTSPSTAIPSGISVHFVETHSVVISEAIDFEVTLHFSGRPSRQQRATTARGVYEWVHPEACVGRRLLWDGVWRGTHGGLGYPLREEARFEARLHPHHLQPSTATHIFLHAHCAACSTQEHPTYAQREWLGQPCRTPDHGLLPSSEALRDPERHRTSKPGGRGAGLASYLGPIRTTTTFHSTPQHCAARTTSNFTGVRRMGSVARVLVGHTRVVHQPGCWHILGKHFSLPFLHVSAADLQPRRRHPTWTYSLAS